MNKDVKKILWTLGLYALSGGLFYNFKELWMADNNLSLTTIGIVMSLGSLISVSLIFLCSNLIKQDKLKNFTCVLLLLKTIILFSLFLLNHSGFNVIIKFLLLIDFAIDVEIYASIYPLITIITKDDKIYAKRGLINSMMYYIGVLLTGVLLGKKIINFTFNYNIYCLMGAIVIFLGFLVLKNTNLEKYYLKDQKSDDQSSILYELLNKLKKDKISHNYLLFVLTGNISYYTITGLTLSLLTMFLGFSSASASNLVLVMGIISVGIGSLVLSKLTLKNDYLNISFKFITRLITYLIAAIFAFNGTYLLALIFTKISSDSYGHISDAPYINRFEGKYQLAFCNLGEMVKYLSRFIGTFICGLVITLGVRYNFIISACFVSLQIYFAFRCIYLRKQELMELK